MVELGLAQAGIYKVTLLHVSKLVALNYDVSGEKAISQICKDRNIGSSEINGLGGRRRWLEICHCLIAKVPIHGVHQAVAPFTGTPAATDAPDDPFPIDAIRPRDWSGFTSARSMR